MRFEPSSRGQNKKGRRGGRVGKGKRKRKGKREKKTRF